MKKIFLISFSMILVFILIGCKNLNDDKVTLPDFHGMDYGDVLKWSFDNDIILEVSSEYNDDVLPNTVFYQEIPFGTKVELNTTVKIIYSRGYSLDGVIVVPDLTGKSIDDVKEWLAVNDIGKFEFYDTFDMTLDLNEYVGYEVDKIEEREENLRKDEYYFYFSKGSLLVEDVDFTDFTTVRGVNLGGWFVLEGWMTPDLFVGISGSDETIFMEEKPNAEEVIEEHWDTFITEDDFIWLSNHGIDYVRLPIPWWLWGEEGYYNSLFYIERAMYWAELYSINVLLDLHAAPGGQNGFDNSGLTNVLEWPEPENVTKTIDILGDIAEHFSSYDSLWGIEVLNEPGWGVNMTILQNFYLDAYDEIRLYNSNIYIGFHDGFRNYDDTWIRFFENNEFNNVFFDMHLYQVFGDGWGDFDIIDHVDFVHQEQQQSIARYEGIVPVVIGEWSLGLQGNVYEGLNYDSIKRVKMAFGNAQLNEYEKAFGWFFWNYKIDASSHLEWDFKRLVEALIFPNQY